MSWLNCRCHVFHARLEANIYVFLSDNFRMLEIGQGDGYDVIHASCQR